MTVDKTMTSVFDDINAGAEEVPLAYTEDGEPGVYRVVFADGSHFRTGRPEAFGAARPS
jgi:hypothetical protein